jgi:hypothetical protein
MGDRRTSRSIPIPIPLGTASLLESTRDTATRPLAEPPLLLVPRTATEAYRIRILPPPPTPSTTS